MSSRDVNNNEFQVLMSPLLSNRLEKMEQKIENLENTYNNINEKFDTILLQLNENSKRWEENKKTYLELLKENKILSQRNIHLLNENRDIYFKFKTDI